MEIKGALINKSAILLDRLGLKKANVEIQKAETKEEETDIIQFPSGMTIKTVFKNGSNYVTYGDLNNCLLEAMSKKESIDLDMLESVMRNAKEKKIDGVYMVLFDTDTEIRKAFDSFFEIDLEKGGKRVPIGTRVTRKSGVVEEKTADGWKVIPKGQRGEKQDEPDKKGDDDTVAIDDDDAFLEVTAESRWEMYRSALWTTLKRRNKCTFAFGSGGVSKSYSLFGKDMLLDKLELRQFDDDLHEPGSDEYDVVKISGKNTVTDFWRNIYNHNGKTLIFDDCDPILMNDDVLGMLKPILDTTGNGTVEYKQVSISQGSEEKTPARIRFTGTMIFVTNISREAIQSPKYQPLTQSRALVCDLTMTKDETIGVIKNIINNGMKIEDADGNPIEDVTQDDINNATEFLEAHKDMIDIGFFNPRKIGNVVKLMVTSRELGYAPSQWVQQAATEFGLKRIKRSFIENRNIELK